MLLNPLIPRKELEKERKVVIEEISKNNDRPTTVLYRNMVKGFYKVHPYKREVIGTKEVIETISREQILDFYNTWYIPQNMTTVVIGDVNTQKALDLIKTKFNKPIRFSIFLKSFYICRKFCSICYMTIHTETTFLSSDVLTVIYSSFLFSLHL